MADHPKSECPECGPHSSTHEPGTLPLYDRRTFLHNGVTLVYPRATILGINKMRAEGTTSSMFLLPEQARPDSERVDGGIAFERWADHMERTHGIRPAIERVDPSTIFNAAHTALDRLDENGDDPYQWTEEDVERMARMRGMTVEQWVEHQIDEITRPSILERVAQAAKDGTPLRINRIGFGSRISGYTGDKPTREQEVRDCQPLPEGVFILEKGEQVIPPPAKNSPTQSFTMDLSKQAKALAVYEWMLKYNPAMVAQILRETT